MGKERFFKHTVPQTSREPGPGDALRKLKRGESAVRGLGIFSDGTGPGRYSERNLRLRPVPATVAPQEQA